MENCFWNKGTLGIKWIRWTKWETFLIHLITLISIDSKLFLEFGDPQELNELNGKLCLESGDLPELIKGTKLKSHSVHLIRLIHVISFTQGRCV